MPSSTSRPGQYSGDELNDLTNLLREAIRTRGGDRRQSALDELAKTPFAPTDWWTETYERSLKTLSPEDRAWVETRISMSVYIFQRQRFQANRTTNTLVDVKERLQEDFVASIAAGATVGIGGAVLLWYVVGFLGG